MKAKLIKGRISGKFMLKMEGVGYITTYKSTLPYKLSLKNCQAIERGYDLDKLISDEVDKLPYEKHVDDGQYNDGQIAGFELGAYWGFQKALELMGDKKFTEEDIKKMMKRATYGWFESDFDKHLDSIQQTEWDVEIEMEKIFYPANMPKEGEERPAYKPKLDVNGCLILKKI